MNQKLGFLCFRGIHNSLSHHFEPSYSWIKIDHFADSLLKLQIKIGVHLINVELSQLLTLFGTHLEKDRKLDHFPQPLYEELALLGLNGLNLNGSARL